MAQGRLINLLFHSFEFSSEYSTIKSHLILTKSKRVLSRGISKGMIEPSEYKIQRLCPFLSLNRREVVMSPSVHTIATSEVVVIFTSRLKRGNYGAFSSPTCNAFNSHFDNSLRLKRCLQS